MCVCLIEQAGKLYILRHNPPSIMPAKFSGDMVVSMHGRLLQEKALSIDVFPAHNLSAIHA